MMSLPRSGVVLQGVDPPAQFRSAVARVEAAGFEHLWLTDSSLHARYVWSYLALAAAATDRIRLGTAVTNPLTRHPGLTALAAGTTDEISEGRFVLGIGAGDRPLHALGMRPARRATLSGAIDDIRALLRGETVDRTQADDGAAATGYAFEDAHLRVPPRPHIPVFVSASGPRTLELAGEMADGVIVLAGLADEGLRFAIDHVERGAERAGRERPHIAVFAYGVIDEDEEHALAEARSIAAWFPQTAPEYCRLAGLDDDLVERVRAAYKGGEFQEAADAAADLPAWFVHKMALSAGRAKTTEQLAGVVDSGADSVHVFALGEDRFGTIDAFADCWKDVVGS